jgi:hypothetical protein
MSRRRFSTVLDDFTLSAPTDLFVITTNASVNHVLYTIEEFSFACVDPVLPAAQNVELQLLFGTGPGTTSLPIVEYDETDNSSSAQVTGGDTVLVTGGNIIVATGCHIWQGLRWILSQPISIVGNGDGQAFVLRSTLTPAVGFKINARIQWTESGYALS